MAEELLSYRRTFLNRWKEQRGGTLVQANPIIDKPPPPQNPPNPKPTEAKSVSVKKEKEKERESGWIRFVEQVEAVNSFFNEPAKPDSKPKPFITPKVKGPADEIAPPFDVQDLPAAMDSVHLKFSPVLLRKWFSNPLNYPTSGAGKIKGIQQDGKPYPEWAIDKTTIKMDWVLSFARTESPYQIITDDDYLFNSKSRKEILKNLQPYKNKRYIDAWAECDGDIHKLHDKFQFQKMKADVEQLDKMLSWVDVSLRGLSVDDLMGALGGFAFYAAIAEAEVSTIPLTGRKRVEIGKIYTYVRNPYSFFDDEPQKGSQYLGHWSKKDVQLLFPDHAAYIFRLSNIWKSHAFKWNGEFFHPIHNTDLRAWQLKHKQGGDMILYSDIKIIIPIIILE